MIVVIALTTIACARIVSTYTVFSQTADEPAHVAAGMELLVQHRYTLHIDNTPMPRVLLALPAWLAGNDYRPVGNIVEQGNSVLYSNGRYRTNLVLVRAANLFFFIIAVVCLWMWSKNALGDFGAIFAVFLFTTQPVILGHAGLATADMAAVAGSSLAIYSWIRWLDAPALRRAVAFGAAYGFAINCKLSCILFIPAAAIAILACRIPSKRVPRLSIGSIAAAAAVCFVIVWAGYGFRIGTVDSIEPVPTQLRGGLDRIYASVPIPAPHLIRGILKLVEGNRRGIPAWLLGESSMRGFVAYFLVTLALKSTIVVLVMALISVFMRIPGVIDAAAAAAGILISVLPSHIDHGVRHILPMYVPLSICAAAALASWLTSGSLVRRAIAVIAILWQTAAGIIAHPDYFPYFNEIAIGRPADYLLDSNVDWGQDLLRLERELRRRHVNHIAIKYFGSADLNRHRLPPHTEAKPEQPVKGWVAVSEMFYYGVWYDGYHPGRWTWLRDREPVIVGKSIRLYFIR